MRPKTFETKLNNYNSAFGPHKSLDLNLEMIQIKANILFEGNKNIVKHN